MTKLLLSSGIRKRNVAGPSFNNNRRLAHSIDEKSFDANQSCRFRLRLAPNHAETYTPKWIYQIVRQKFLRLTIGFRISILFFIIIPVDTTCSRRKVMKKLLEPENGSCISDFWLANIETATSLPLSQVILAENFIGNLNGLYGINTTGFKSASLPAFLTWVLRLQYRQ